VVIGLGTAAVLVVDRRPVNFTAAPLEALPNTPNTPSHEAEPPHAYGVPRSASIAPAPDEQDPVPVSAPTIVDVAPVTIHPRHAAMVDHFERVFRDQARAETWADEREREFREFFASKPEAAGSRLLSADCRSSLCRLRIAHNEPAALSRFEGSLGLYPPFAVAGARFPDPDADRSVLFLARKDTALPWPDPATLPPAEVQ
jgi:hypothetical protein